MISQINRTNEESIARTSPALELNGIIKRYPGVTALDSVDLTVLPGEVHVLAGENGAGKSTILKIIAGSESPDAGSIRIAGVAVDYSTPRQAQSLGIAMVQQETSLVPDLSAVENVVLGHETTRHGILQKKSIFEKASAPLDRLGFTGDRLAPVRTLSVAQQQIVEMARALLHNSSVLILDEPTASLSARETERLFSVIRELKRDGSSIIYVSHRMEELFTIGDRVTVLRDGKVTLRSALDESTDAQTIIRAMVGRSLETRTVPGTEAPDNNAANQASLSLTVEHLTRRPAFHDVTFDVRPGEIVALSGLVGSGRTEVVRAIFGADRVEAGTVTINGKRMGSHWKPRDSIRAGAALLTEDRKSDGLVLGLPIASNVSLPSLKSRLGWINRRRQLAIAESVGTRVGLRKSARLPAGSLSGGNQQKVVLMRWLASKSQLFIFDEPTRGIDVGAKSEIYSMMRELTAQGAGILMVSSELPEVLSIADRILVMRMGQLVAEYPGSEADEELLASAAAGEYFSS